MRANEAGRSATRRLLAASGAALGVAGLAAAALPGPATAAIGQGFTLDPISDGRYAGPVGYGAAVSDDGNLVLYRAYGPETYDPLLLLHDRATGADESLYVTADGAVPDFDVNAASLSGDGRVVAFTTWATNMGVGEATGLAEAYVVDRTTGELDRIDRDRPFTEVQDPSLSGDGELLALTEYDVDDEEPNQRVIVIDVDTEAIVAEVAFENTFVNDIALSADGTTAVAVIFDIREDVEHRQRVVVIDVATSTVVAERVDWGGGTVAIDGAGDRVAYVSDESLVVAWDWAAPAAPRTFVLPVAGDPELVSLSRDGRFLAVDHDTEEPGDGIGVYRIDLAGNGVPVLVAGGEPETTGTTLTLNGGDADAVEAGRARFPVLDADGSVVVMDVDGEVAAAVTSPTPGGNGGNGGVGQQDDGCVAPALGDIAGDVHETGIRAVVEACLMAGQPDGTFRPTSAVTRGQLATTLARGFDLADPGAAAPSFADVAGDVHAAGIRAAAAAGIVDGFPDGTFRPSAPVTRGQLASILSAALDLPPAGAPAFTDVAGDVHADGIARVAAAGLVRGRPDGTFGPSEVVTRGQLASVLAAALDLA